MIGTHDVLVVGAGLAEMRAAIAAHDAGANVALVSKLHLTHGHSGAAEGGINAALGNATPDTPEQPAFDTVKGSDFLGDQDAIEVFTAEAPEDIYGLERLACAVARGDPGSRAEDRAAAPDLHRRRRARVPRPRAPRARACGARRRSVSRRRMGRRRTGPCASASRDRPRIIREPNQRFPRWPRARAA